MSGMRQWGIALNYYVSDYDQCIPEEGNISATTFMYNGNWYNGLPVFVNAPRYYYIYAGLNARVGTTVTDDLGVSYTLGANSNSGYKNAWIWYCPTKLLSKKNSSSNLNSFQYIMNSTLDGVTSNATSPWGKDKASPYHNRMSLVTQPSSTVFLFEGTSNNPCDSPASNSNANFSGADTSNIDSNRHLNNSSSNFLFMDSHVDSVPGKNVKLPLANVPFPLYQNNPTLIWGPFF